MRFFVLKFALCWAGVAAAFVYQTENHSRPKQEWPLEIQQAQNRMRRGTLESKKSGYGDELEEAQENALKERTEVPSKQNLNQRTKIVEKFNNRRRCLLGSLDDCYPELFDASFDCSSPWGWRPGPLYPEYGPDFHRGWMGHGHPFGFNHNGFGCPYRGPGCCCGCNNPGGNLGCGSCNGNHWLPFNDVVGSTPKASNDISPAKPQSFFGKPSGPKAPLRINSGKTKAARRGSKRFDVTHNAGDSAGVAWPSTSGYPCDASYGNWPCQTPVQENSIGDRVVGTLFLWKPNGNPSPNKHKSKKAKSY
ncbi:uncharacterized protein [Montipora foliosa]|uniref:uncharacterized protein isoform X1 n=1 Tax=Montipora foliosa TaxID=591990 RepID=UPI0035F0FE8F